MLTNQRHDSGSERECGDAGDVVGLFYVLRPFEGRCYQYSSEQSSRQVDADGVVQMLSSVSI